ncbi:hypothetical protein HS088_TW18G00421 [Tripterygium wilfordii]|uniref:DUF4378 domain-containing protein n=1 Tax=Tripterygium wilfordii TaxID=458696 RepID=A0A7J7CDC7_TRIWF|nr:uncharacterized protein LOC119984039 [Tripterygium wilfordii]XP_038683722.1 uncharacterized protein LOC119984039 [Tripterygium wilfordii]KAF5731736.1 hypothetical protein HS088_TW18G00421 [Tripterygium wilfordii]
MGKRSQRHPVRYEKDPSGCMWGLIGIFDFRHGRTTQKLVTDRRRGGRHASGAANSRNKHDKLIHLNENCQGTPDGEEGAKLVADANKPSVKELIEEEMFSDQDTGKEASSALEKRKTDTENGSQNKRNHKKTNGTHSRSCDIDAAKNLEPEHSCLEKLEKEFINHVDMEKIMEKLCQRIKLMSSLNHEQHAEVNSQPNQKIQDLKEKMGRVIELFITQEIISVNHIAEDGDVHLPENLINVLQILCADDELFLKLVQDPSSILIKYGHCMQNTSVEEGEDSKTLVGPKVSDHEPRNSRQSDELVKRKQRKFFRRKAKSMEIPVSKGSMTSPQASNTIIILKPALQNSETESCIGSSPDSHPIVRNKGPSERIGSHFFITEIKRKLKNAMGKERPEIYTDDVLRTSYESHHLGANDKGTKENVGMSSPRKEHFIERIARPSTGFKKGDKISKLKHCETAVENEAARFSKQRMSNIYVEAKKHFSERLNMRDGDVVSSSRQVPKTLGRILSLPEYNASPFGSPGRDWGHGFVTAQMRLTNSDKCQKHENGFSHEALLAQNLESQSSISDANADNAVQPRPNPTMENVSEVVIDNEGTISSVMDKLTCQGDEICRSADIAVEEEIISFSTPPQPSVSTDITIDEQDGDICEACDEQKNSECQETCEGKEQTFSPPASPSNASITKAVEDVETTVYIPERPSPVSVLEPLFTEDDISPSSTKSESAELPVQPLRIQFEECDSSTTEDIHLKTCVDDSEQIVEYIRAVLQASDLKWDEVYLMSSTSEQLLDPLLFEELEISSDQLCHDRMLLFDCINEVLVDLYQPYFGCSPWSSFVKLSIRPVLEMKNATLEVWKGVNWHLIPLPLPHTLDQILKKDMAKTGTWMDLRFDTESIVFEMGEVIFEELMEDTVLSCINGSSETGELLLLDEIKENRNAVIT